MFVVTPALKACSHEARYLGGIGISLSPRVFLGRAKSLYIYSMFQSFRSHEAETTRGDRDSSVWKVAIALGVKLSRDIHPEILTFCGSCACPYHHYPRHLGFSFSHENQGQFHSYPRDIAYPSR